MLKLVIAWIYRNFITFLIIVTVLVGGAIFLPIINKPVDVDMPKKIKILQDEQASLQSEINILEDGKKSVARLKEVLIKETTTRLESLQGSTEEKINKRIVDIDRDISVSEGNKCSIKDRILHLKKCLISDAKNTLRVKVLEYERGRLEELVKYLKAIFERDTCGKDLQPFKDVVDRKNVRIDEKKDEIKALKEICDKPNNGMNRCNKKKERLRREHGRLERELEQAENIYLPKKRVCDDIETVLKPLIKISKIDITTELELDKFIIDLKMKNFEISEKLRKLEQENPDGPILIDKIAKNAVDAIPTALKILASIIFFPITIKAFLYFLIAPIASRGTSNCLMPETSGVINAIDDSEDETSENFAKARTIEVAGTDELLIHNSYALITPMGSFKDTRWLLDYRFPLSSVASGMYALNRYRNDSGDRYELNQDPLYPLSVISLPEDSAVVLHPHSLIGIVQRRDHPVTITRHWRLTSLHAWLTLQLRYLVFHGPGSLIVKGGGGVSIKRAEIGRSINQAATIGFSANLSYATTRAEPFFGYLTGKQELFDDTFPSGQGYFIYEKAPFLGETGGPLFGKGPKGILDSLLKLFGV